MYNGCLLTVDLPGQTLPSTYVLIKGILVPSKGSFDSRSRTRSRSG